MQVSLVNVSQNKMPLCFGQSEPAFYFGANSYVSMPPCESAPSLLKNRPERRNAARLILEGLWDVTHGLGESKHLQVFPPKVDEDLGQDSRLLATKFLAHFLLCLDPAPSLHSFSQHLFSWEKKKINTGLFSSAPSRKIWIISHELL